VKGGGRVRENGPGAVVMVMLTGGEVSGGDLESSQARGSGCGRDAGGYGRTPSALARTKDLGVMARRAQTPEKNVGNTRRREARLPAPRVNTDAIHQGNARCMRASACSRSVRRLRHDSSLGLPAATWRSRSKALRYAASAPSVSPSPSRASPKR